MQSWSTRGFRSVSAVSLNGKQTFLQTFIEHAELKERWHCRDDSLPGVWYSISCCYYFCGCLLVVVLFYVWDVSSIVRQFIRTQYHIVAAAISSLCHKDSKPSRLLNYSKERALEVFPPPFLSTLPWSKNNGKPTISLWAQKALYLQTLFMFLFVF